MKSCLANIWSSLFNLVDCYGNEFENLRLPNLKEPISPLLLVIEVLNVKTTYRKSYAPNLLLVSDLTLDPSFKVKCGSSYL